MVNSHYVPQFILRNFCDDDHKITYCDLENKKVESRNTKSVFSEIGYYPEEIEKDLCKNVEYLFANLYHNKIENSGSKVVLTAEELFLLKKYLIITTLRYRYEDSEEEAELRKLMGENFQQDFYGNINKILRCSTFEDIIKILDIDIFGAIGGKTEDNIPLCMEVRDVIHSYIIFVKTRGSEKFLIPDIGKGIYEGPMSRRKMYGTLDLVMKQSNPILTSILPMLTPHDYTVYPLAKDMAILSMSVFFKLFTNSEFKCNVKLPADCPTVSSMLGFGSRDVINPPKVKYNGKEKEYRYEVQQMTPADIAHFNSLMIAEAKKFIACAGLESIKRTVDIAKGYTECDLDFLMI